MLVQPKKDAYEESGAFEDRSAMQPPPPGTVPWRHQRMGSADPPEVTRGLLTRGRERFETFCGACHGVDGHGRTVVARNMALRPPPSLHDERVRGYGAEGLYEIATRGYGLMPGYEAQLTPRDRWAVAHYVKALQLSRHAPVSALPTEMRRHLREEVEP